MLLSHSSYAVNLFVEIPWRNLAHGRRNCLILVTETITKNTTLKSIYISDAFSFSLSENVC